VSGKSRWGGKNYRAVRGTPKTPPKATRGQDRPLKGTVGWPTLRDGTQVVPEALPMVVVYQALAGPEIHGGLQSVHWCEDDEAWKGLVKFPTSLDLVDVRLSRLRWQP
jgi:hypothetical protein